jgi:hypothetical protein
MATLSGILGLMLLAVIVGKHTRHVRMESYILIAALVLIEVFLMVLKMYTMTEPGF